MAVIRPFRAIRPDDGRAAEVAALPYDVYDREEAFLEVQGKPYSFLNIDRPETQFDAAMDIYDPAVYEKADEMLRGWLAEGVLKKEEKPCYYVYALTMDGRTQTGLVAASAVDDYISGVIKKHENTRADKEQDRVNHVDRTSMQTGPIFLAYRPVEGLRRLFNEVKAEAPLCDFTSADGIRHACWKIDDDTRIRMITDAFAAVPNTYIADGHHRAASAVRVALKRRESHPDFTGAEEFNFFLSVIFPMDELKILDYNRVVKDLNGLSEEAFLTRISADFTVSSAETGIPLRPSQKGEFGMFLKDKWYVLKVKPEHMTKDPVKGLDVSLLQDLLLSPVLGIKDPKTDKRIEFIGGIRGLRELELRVHEGMAVAFSMYPTSMDELFSVADAGLLMPPKSTWFEPKLRSGLFIHEFER